MNTNGLAKYYDCLNPWERLSLILSASARGDDGECERLARAAPRVNFRVPNYWGLAEGLDELAKLYVLRQLELVGLYWQLTVFLEQAPLVPLVFEKKRAEKSEKRLWRALQTLACTFVVRADGWKLLCAELHVDPDDLIRELPGHDSICDMEEAARQIACSPEEAAANLRERDAERDEPANGEAPTVRREYPIVTAEDVARSMRKCLEMKLASWS